MPKQTKQPKQATVIQATESMTQYDWGQVPIHGFEHVNQEDLGIPFLMILQKGSPEVDRTNKDYAIKKIPNARVGDIINTITREVVYDVDKGKPLRFIPCGFEKLFVEWKPRESGGGMVKVHRTVEILAECRRNERGQDQLRNGNLIVTTAYFAGLYKTNEGRVPAIIPMSSTQLKKARMWLNMMMAIKLTGPKGIYTPPMFSHEYLITTTPESNEKGSWFGWQIERGEQQSDPTIIAEAIEHAKRIVASQRAALPPAAVEESETPFM